MYFNDVSIWPVLLLERGEGEKEGMRRGGEEERRRGNTSKYSPLEGTH